MVCILLEKGKEGQYNSNRTYKWDKSGEETMKKIQLNYDLNSAKCNEEISRNAEQNAAGHFHSDKKVILNRLAKAAGHLQAVKKMVENERDCTEILIQLSAVIAALNNTGKILLDDHIEHCIVDAVKSGDKDAVDNLKVAIDRFVK